MVLGIDTSHWQGVASQQQIDCLYNKGYRFWVVGLQNPTIFVPLIRRLRDDGRWRIEGYEYLYQSPANGGPPEKQVRDSIRQLQDGGVIEAVKRFWLDYEDGGEMWGDAEVDQALALDGICRAAGLPTGFYSSEGWLNANVSKAAQRRLTVLPLWLADWDNIAGAGSHPWPWWPLHSKQYSGDQGSECSITIDKNWRPQEIWDAEEGDDMSTPEALLKAARAMNREQLGELNNILDAGPVARVGYPAAEDEPKLYVSARHGLNRPYNDVGDITRGLEAHWYKDRASESGGPASEHSHPLPDHGHEIGGVTER